MIAMTLVGVASLFAACKAGVDVDLTPKDNWQTGGAGGSDCDWCGTGGDEGDGSGAGGDDGGWSSGAGGNGSGSSGAGGSGQGGSGQGGTPSCVSGLPWSDRFGDATEQSSYDIAYDPQGNLVVTGRFKGVINFGGGALYSAGNFDVFVAKFSPDGDHLWSRSFGTTVYDAGRALAIDAQGNIIIAGEFMGTNLNFGGNPLNTAGGADIFLAKLDAQGNHLWSDSYAGSNHQNVYGVAVDKYGNSVIVGRMAGTVDLGGVPLKTAGNYDAFAAKFDAAGNHLWSDRFGDKYFQTAYDVAVDNEGGIFLTGEYKGRIDFGDGPLPGAGTEKTRAFVAKLDPQGVYEWAFGYGSNTSTQLGMALAVHPGGDVIVAGQFGGKINLGGVTLATKGNYDIFLARLDGGTGAHVWSTRFGDKYVQRAFGLAVAQDGTIWMNGDFQGKVDFGGGALTSAGGFDMFLARYDDQGYYIDATRYGDANKYQPGLNKTTTKYHQDGRGAIAVNCQGMAAVTGTFGGSIDYGQGPLNSAGSYDIFVAQIAP